MPNNLENIANNQGKIEVNEDLDIQIDNKLEDLWNRIWEKYNDWDYAYKVEENDWVKKYIPTIKWIDFPRVDTPEDLINVLKWLDAITFKILNIYKENWSSDEFYAWKWLWSFIDAKTETWERFDLYLDNRPTDFLDTVYLTNEWLQWVLGWKDVSYTNQFIKQYALVLNKLIKQ